MRLIKVNVVFTVIILIFLNSCTKSFSSYSGYIREYPETLKITEPKGETEVRAIWFSYLDYSKYLANLNMQEYNERINEIFSEISEFGFNTVIFQVLPFADAFYNSEIHPASAYVSGELGKKSDYDALELAVEAAHNKNLKIEAWINPFRAYTDEEAQKLDEEYIFSKWYRDETKKGDYIVKVDSRWYYNPAREEVKKQIGETVKEIVKNYKVDGIHIDDYFYPTTDESFDKKAYEEVGENKELSVFRREQISAVISEIYSSVKKTNPKVTFGISPSGNIESCYNKHYLDVYNIVSGGYADYIAPQLYYSFKQSFYSYTYALDKWKNLSWGENTTLNAGLAAYKLKGLYTYYTEEEKKDWAENDDMLSRQLSLLREVKNYGGFAVYSYSDFFKNNQEVIQTEKNNFKQLL